MRSSLVIVCVAIVVLTGVLVMGAGGEREQLFYGDLATHFGVERSAVDGLVDAGVAEEDLAVTLFLAEHAQIGPLEVAAFRSGGDSWQAIMAARNVRIQALYFMVSGEISDGTFGPIFDKFRNTPESRWSELNFSDAEVANMINLRFVYSHNDYSAFSVMVMRDRAKRFVDINYDVHTAKADVIKRQKAKARAAAAEKAAEKVTEDSLE